jgi:predicted RNA-binding Zn-ribbon protein involved in translation (DUF1610 family)
MDLVITAGVVLVTFLAVAAIITKAGFARPWLLVPLAPVIAWSVTIVLLRIRFHSFVNVGVMASIVPSTLSSIYGTKIAAMFTIDWVTLADAWLFLLFFAFARWPIEASDHSLRRSGPSRNVTKADREGDLPIQSVASPQAPSHRPPPRGPGFGALAFVPGPGTPVQKNATTIAERQANRQLATFCARCGDSIPGNRAIGHECPNAGEPMAFCRYCGKPNAEDLHTCSSCGASW